MEAIKKFLMGNIALGSFELPTWALILAVLGVVILLVIIIASISKKHVSGSEIHTAAQIIQDIQNKKNLAKKDFIPPVPTYEAFADLPDPESTSKPIDVLADELLGTNNAVTVESNPEENPSDNIVEPKPLTEEETALDKQMQEEKIVENNNEENNKLDSTITPVPVNDENNILEEEKIEALPEEVVEPVQEVAEEVTFNNDVTEEVAQEEEISFDNIVEEVAQEELIEEAPIEEIVEEEPKEEIPAEESITENIIEDVPAVEEASIEEQAPIEDLPTPIEEPVQEEAPIEDAPVPKQDQEPEKENISPVIVPVAVAEEEPVEEKQESAFSVTITPAVPVIGPTKAKKVPLQKKATLVKAPMARPNGPKPRKASTVKRNVASNEPKKNIAENTITTFAPITKIEGDQKVQIIKLFGDKVEPSRGKYVVIKDEENLIKPFSFALKANNGQILFTSQGYKIHPRARQIETFRKAIEMGTFNYVKTKSGDFTFKLLAADGKIFGKGMEYPTIEGAEKACESVKKFAERANYIEDSIE